MITVNKHHLLLIIIAIRDYHIVEYNKDYSVFWAYYTLFMPDLRLAGQIV